MMKFYTLYKSPADYPGKFVLRRWREISGTARRGAIVAVGDDREDILKEMPELNNMAFLARSPEDEGCIEGSYI